MREVIYVLSKDQVHGGSGSCGNPGNKRSRLVTYHQGGIQRVSQNQASSPDMRMLEMIMIRSKSHRPTMNRCKESFPYLVS